MRAQTTPYPRIASASPAAAAALALLHGACFARAWDAAAMTRILEGGGLGLLACDGERPVGFVLARAAGLEGEVLTLAVHPHARRRGAGTALMQATQAALRAQGVRELYLEVGVSNAGALALYERLGFERAGMRPGYYRTASDGHAEDALVLMRRLDQPGSAGGRSNRTRL